LIDVYLLTLTFRFIISSILIGSKRCDTLLLIARSEVDGDSECRL
jgi:hypothetical protein